MRNGCPGGYSLMTPVRTESSDAKFATRAYELKSDKPRGQNLVGNKNRRLLVSTIVGFYPRYFSSSQLHPGRASRGADAGLLLLCWYHGTYTLYHTSTS